jgi:hypothetical protein
MPLRVEASELQPLFRRLSLRNSKNGFELVESLHLLTSDEMLLTPGVAIS